MFRKLAAGFVLLVALMLPTAAMAAKGIVVAQCGSRILVSAPRGFAILDVYGIGPDKGQTIAGDFESYGMKELFNLTADSDFRVYVEEYWLSRDNAIEKFYDKCR